MRNMEMIEALREKSVQLRTRKAHIVRQLSQIHKELDSIYELQKDACGEHEFEADDVFCIYCSAIKED